MKKIVITLFLCIILCSCDVSTRGVTDNEKHFGSVSASAVTASATVPSGSATVVGKNKPIIVTDMTGQTRELKMGNVNVKNIEGAEFLQFTATAAYSQVMEGHYYYMRSDGKRNYTVYRDKGKKVGTFSLKKGFVEYFTGYKGKFYALIRELPETQNSSRNYYRALKLFEIDLKKQIMLEICDCSKDLNLGKAKKDDPVPIGLFQGMYLFLYDNEKKLGRFDIKERKVITSGKSKDMVLEHVPWYWLYFDEEIYYAVRYEAEVVIYRLNLKSGVKEEIFRYSCVDVFRQPEIIKGYSKGEVIGLDIDEDYIYCQGNGIPRRGGEMVRLFRFEKNTENQPPYAHNDRYVFYMNDSWVLHRIDKKTLENTIIYEGAIDVKCINNDLYVQGYDLSVSLDHYDWDDEEEHYSDQKSDIADSCDLYYMDVNGKNIKQIWEGKECE